MEERIPLIADEGKVYTNGVNDYGTVIYLAESVDPSAYYQITEEEYNAILEKESSEQLEPSEQASAEDYEAALARLEVK